jgi:hypothetical protein
MGYGRLVDPGEPIDGPLPWRSVENCATHVCRGGEHFCATTGEVAAMLVVAFLPEDIYFVE